MAADWQVNGPAVVYVSESLNGPFQRFGYTESGLRGRHYIFKEPCHSDVAGPKMPHVFQDMGEALAFSGKFVVYDPDVLDWMRSRGDKTLVGNINSVGALVRDTQYAFHLWVVSTSTRPHHLFQVTLYEGEDFLLGTRRTEDDVQFYGWPVIGSLVDSAVDSPLYEYALPAGYPFV